MKVIKETIGNTTIVIQTIDESLEVLGEENGRATQLTGVGDKIEGAYAKAKTAIKEIAADIGAELKAIEEMDKPKEVEVEFQIGLSAQVGPVLILGGKGESAMTVKMTWDLDKG